MAIHSIYILSKSGGLIYQYDHIASRQEVEKTFNYPLDIQLSEQNKRICVAFGQRDEIKVGHSLLAVNGFQVNGPSFNDGNQTQDVNSFLNDESNFPVTLKFGRQKLSTNEKIFLGK